MTQVYAHAPDQRAYEELITLEQTRDSIGLTKKEWRRFKELEARLFTADYLDLMQPGTAARPTR